MSFNLDPTKQAQEFIFTRKVKNVVHPPIFLNKKQVQQVSSQKHSGLILDTYLTFNEQNHNSAAEIQQSITTVLSYYNLQNILEAHLNYAATSI